MDEANASVEGNFTVSLLNVLEDLDGDGVEDFYDSDDDGDGYSDAEEVAYGSDPRDAASVANGTRWIKLRIANYGEPISWHLVGVLSATDADTDDLLRYELLAGEGDSGNHWFVLDANGSLYSSTIFDYETNATQYAIRARALDEANASVEVSLIVDLLNVVEDIDGDGIEDHYDLQDDRIEIPTSEIGPDGMLYEISENKYTLYEAKKFALREEAVIPAIKVLPWNAPLDPLTEYLRGFLIAELGRKECLGSDGFRGSGLYINGSQRIESDERYQKVPGFNWASSTRSWTCCA